MSAHTHGHGHGHGHSHGLVHDSIKRSREGLRTVGLALAVLGLTALAQAAVFVATDSVALLADLIHNFGDASTAIPLGIAFALRSARAERWAGLAVVLAIFVSACVAGVVAVERLIDPHDVEEPVAVVLAGLLGFGGNWVAAGIRARAGRRLDSPALVADAAHARADAYVSLAVVASAIVVVAGLQIADPVIGLAITAVILRITWQSWQTVHGHHTHETTVSCRPAPSTRASVCATRGGQGARVSRPVVRVDEKEPHDEQHGTDCIADKDVPDAATPVLDPARLEHREHRGDERQDRQRLPHDRLGPSTGNRLIPARVDVRVEQLDQPADDKQRGERGEDES